MSDYERGPWCKIWDGLYWNFISKNKKLLQGNPRMKLIISQLRKMDSKVLRRHIKTAESFLTEL
jgi:deoxyribodipyrimidine photolyase-related protein